MKRSLALIVLAGASVAVPVWAADQGGYVGLGVGGSDWKADSVNGATGSSHGTAGKVFGGYQFNQNLGVELGYADLGKFGSDATGTARQRAASVDAVGKLPLGSSGFSALGRLGVANTRTTTSIAGVDSSDRGTGPHAGLGVQYDLSKNAGVRAEWERYRVKGFGETNNTDLGTVSFVYAF